jgi:transcriptional regulator with PAS, ATPase and Fis domain
MPKSHNIFEARSALIEYRQKSQPRPSFDEQQTVNLQTTFKANPVNYEPQEVREDQIELVYQATGKSNPEAQLNCGACGYKTCRDNAVAVVRGMAEPQMCMPYMRRLAQQRSDKVIETSPSGVVVLDSELCIINMNPAFMKMFSCNNSILGRRISYLVNADGYDLLRSGDEESFETVRAKYGIRYHEVLHALRDEQQYVGTYTDISRLKFDSRQIDLVKRQTLEQAKELLDQQITFSQEMAHYLGRSTAQNEEFVRRLMTLFDDEDTIRGESP